MRKVNLWNRLFHSGDLLEQEKQYQCLGIIIDAYPSLKKSMEAASSLGDLLVIHRQAWGFGFQNEKLGPCSYGMFRAMNILEMKPEEVFRLSGFTREEFLNLMTKDANGYSKAVVYTHI